jgi:DNA-binding transcriptional regulator GbsR (MarR family)
MDLPIEVIEAVKPKAEPKKRAPYVKKLTKRILHAIGNGLRTSTSIANALNVPKAKIHSNLAHMKTRGLVYSHKQVGSNEHKYHLTTDKPVLDKLDLTPKKKARKTYAKRKSVYNEAGVNTTNSFNTPPKPTKEEVELNHQLDRMMQRLNALELSLVEKEKEVWTLECEVFDKKAIIKYLEEKLFQLGVRV